MCCERLWTVAQQIGLKAGIPLTDGIIYVGTLDTKQRGHASWLAKGHPPLAMARPSSL